jgi:hypothetical protein
VNQLKILANTPLALSTNDAPLAQPKGDILCHSQVRKQGILLVNEPDIAAVSWHPCQIVSIQPQRSTLDWHETSNST